MPHDQDVTLHLITAAGGSKLCATRLDMGDIPLVESTIDQCLSCFGLQNSKGLVQVRDASGRPLHNFSIRKPTG